MSLYWIDWMMLYCLGYIVWYYTIWDVLDDIIPSSWNIYYTALFNSLRWSFAYMWQYNIATLVQIMAYCLLITKPLSEPMLPYCQFDHWEHISVKFYLKLKKNSFQEMQLKMPSAKWLPFCLSLKVLNKQCDKTHHEYILKQWNST